MSSNDLYSATRVALDAGEPEEKVRLTHALFAAWRAGALACGGGEPEPIGEPGRPERPVLVRPRDLPRRKPTTPEGLAVLFHALTHIEFNAINLALDAVYRFRALPDAFRDDWLRVADEEANHFMLLRDHLRSFGHDYGDFVAHNGLWEMARDTAYDALVRMALVPRCLEARGLDVNPGIQARLREVGDEAGVAALEVILRDEIGHVAIGNRWFHHLCAERGLDPRATFDELVARHMKGPLRGPFFREARLDAGFSVEELDYLEGVGTPGQK